MATPGQETITSTEFRAAHKALGHLTIGMPGVPACPGAADVPEGVPGWAKCLPCDIVVDDPIEGAE